MYRTGFNRCAGVGNSLAGVSVIYARFEGVEWRQVCGLSRFVGGEQVVGVGTEQVWDLGQV